MVATAGTAYVQLEHLTWLALVLSVGVGLLAVAILVANNLRDIPGDTEHGKRTLAVRLGDAGTRRLYVGCLGTTPLRRSWVRWACSASTAPAGSARRT